ncbi:ferritin-like domain-containing protein [Paraburkholderia sp. EG287A]|uniref:ferritin-like domain-containing protein n=1 Tax=unclassified Paraburkholderia TaxID=2615204 RepID=UPI0034D23C09
MSTLPAPKNRTELIALLTEACELEHGLACSYLYTAFSLKQRTAEAGLNVDQCRKVRFWASQIFFIASQEMMHLAQAWNLLIAIGGTPHCLRPNLPQGTRYYPLRASIALEPFSENVLKRFIVYETPHEAEVQWVRQGASFTAAEATRGHVTIGELYGAIEHGFRYIANLIQENSENQIDHRRAQFYDIVRVTSVHSAIQAIGNIVHQGEGAVVDRLDCHYGMFISILNEYRQLRDTAGPEFQPVRPVMSNPVAESLDGYGAAAHPIKNPLTRRCAELFDEIYLLMLQSLASGFSHAMDAERATKIVRTAIEVMVTTIRPLGDALCCMPADVNGLNGGPGFGITRFNALPADLSRAVDRIVSRLGELANEADALAAELPSMAQIASVAGRLNETAARLSN